MSRTTGRKPVSNFFIKKSLQIGLISEIIGAVTFASIVSVGTILSVYYFQHSSVSLYRLSDLGNLTKENIFGLLLPSLLISIIVNIMFGLIIGLYASRAFAVPVYKLEQWATLLRAGKLHTLLSFREKKKMASTVTLFNNLAVDLRGELLQVKKALESGKEADLSAALAIMNRFDFGHEYAISEKSITEDAETITSQ